MHVTMVRHSWQEKQGFSLLRKPGDKKEYILIHYHTPSLLTFNGEQQAVSRGSFIVFSPGTSYEINCPVPLIHDWMHLMGDIDVQMSSYGLTPNTLYQLDSSTRITAIAERLELAHIAQRPFLDALDNAMLTELFIHVAYDLQSHAYHVHLDLQMYRQLKELRSDMRAHPELGWSNQRLAEILNVSPSRVYPLYKSLFGVTPNHDLISIRIAHAKGYLVAGRSVSEIAELLGYANVTHFIRQFKQHTGTTPARFLY